jgi:septal ring-binding cell division protein DamX
LSIRSVSVSDIPSSSYTLQIAAIEHPLVTFGC